MPLGPTIAYHCSCLVLGPTPAGMTGRRMLAARHLHGPQLGSTAVVCHQARQ